MWHWIICIFVVNAVVLMHCDQNPCKSPLKFLTFKSGQQLFYCLSQLACCVVLCCVVLELEHICLFVLIVIHRESVSMPRSRSRVLILLLPLAFVFYLYRYLPSPAIVDQSSYSSIYHISVKVYIISFKLRQFIN